VSAGVAIPETPTSADELAPGALSGGEIVPFNPVREVRLPGRDEWRQLAGMANALAESGMLGKHLNGRPKAVMAVILKGRELGLPPMEALNSIYVIEGIPTLSAHLMLALIRRAGHRVWFSESSGAGATICGQRREWDGELGPVESVTWTIDMARAAGLLNKDNWKHYPDAMLRARAATALARMTFSDVLMGAVYSPEELGARVGQGGEVVSMPSPAEAIAAASGLAGEAAEQGGAPAKQAPVAVEGDPAADLHGDTIEGEVVAPEPLDRAALWAELLDQARLAGQSYRAYTTRWARAHKKNIDEATTGELSEFVTSRRSFIDDLVRENPAARDNKPVGKEPECPVDPETGEAPPPPASDEVEDPGTAQVSGTVDSGGGTEGPGNPDTAPAASLDPPEGYETLDATDAAEEATVEESEQPTGMGAAIAEAEQRRAEADAAAEAADELAAERDGQPGDDEPDTLA